MRTTWPQLSVSVIAEILIRIRETKKDALRRVGWVGWVEWLGVCTEHDNEEAKKPRWRDLSIIPSLTAVIVRIPHPPHCTPLCTTAVVELHLGRTFDLRIRFFNLFLWQTSDQTIFYLFGEHIKPSVHWSSRSQSPPP